jgi:hypothetical protein
MSYEMLAAITFAVSLMVCVVVASLGESHVRRYS